MQKFEITATRGATSTPIVFEEENESRDMAIWLAGVKYGGGAAINAHEMGVLDMMLSVSDRDTMVRTLGIAASEEKIEIKQV